LDFESYKQGVGYALNEETYNKVLESISLIENSGIAYEFRTTAVKGLHRLEQIRSLRNRFGKTYKIQNFNPGICLKPNAGFQTFSKAEIIEMCRE